MPIVLFTTAGSDRPLYRRDVLNAICLPSDWHLSFSYRKKWVADELIARFEAGELEGMPALVVLCGDEFKKKLGRALPLRWTTIVHAQIGPKEGGSADIQEGEADKNRVVSLDLKMGRRPSKEEIQLFATSSVPKVPKQVDDIFVAYCDFRTQGSNEVSWEDQAQAVRQVEETKDCQLFSIVEIAKLKKRWRGGLKRTRVAVSGRQPLVRGVTEMELASGELYSIETYLNEGARSDSQPPQVSVQGEHVSVSEPLVRQQGSGAAVSYLLAVERVYTSSLETLLIGGADNSALASPGIQVLASVGPSRGFWPLSICGLVIAALLIRLPAATTCLPAGVALLSEVAGVTVFAITAWFAARRLPMRI